MSDLSSCFDFEGWNIRYKLTESGISRGDEQKRPVVFVHGTPWSSAVFRPLIEALLARGGFQILLYDLPGYGLSQSYQSQETILTPRKLFEGDTSVKFQAKALAALLKHTKMDASDGLPAPAVVAHDIAGTIVLRAHLLHGCAFASMCLMDANAVLPWGDGFYKQARSNPEVFLEFPRATYDAVVRSVVRSACCNPKILQAGWEDILAEPWLDKTENDSDRNSSQRQRSFVRQIAQANDADVAEMLEVNMYASVNCPVKIIWGEQDSWIPRHKVEDLIQRLADKVEGVAFVPNAGHLVMIDQPERVAVEIFDWLNRGNIPRNTSSRQN